MNLEVIWSVEITTPRKTYGLAVMAECEIEKSVKNLADRATIIIPEYFLNKKIDFDGMVERGDQIRIKFGYKGLIYETEFEGYIREINSNGGNLTVECEDALFLFRKDVADKQFTNAGMATIAQYLLAQVGEGLALDCDYPITYEKFTIHRATAYDVLKKLQEETGADIYFEDNTLHIHPAYIRKGADVAFSPQQNIEKFSLEYKKATDRKVEVTVERVGLDGKVESFTTGQPGGEKITKKVTTMDAKSIRIIAENEYRQRMTDGYEGSFESWAYPQVLPGDTVSITDEDYRERDSSYYVDSVKTKFSPSGIVRTVELGIKLSA
ncbi:MAG: hypothetical protein H3C36_02840 [Chitinophagaceae bacterium]|nr:hypothetical protein [Chitinophagaceae bacterium]